MLSYIFIEIYHRLDHPYQMVTNCISLILIYK